MVAPNKEEIFVPHLSERMSLLRKKITLLMFFFLPTVVSAQGINSALVYVGASVPQWGSDPDMGAQINVAYSSCPSTGCSIELIPKTDGSCYDFSKPIKFATPGKYVSLQGGGPTSQAPGTPTVAGATGGSCLNYLPTGASVAITMDYAPRLGGGNAPSHGIRDLVLQNNSCQKISGCGSSATGVQFGGVNSGAQNGFMSHVRVNGFGTGLSYLETGSQSWGMALSGLSITENTLGISFTGSLENISIFGGRINTNRVGISITGNADIFAYGVSVDSNTTAGVTANSGLFSCSGCHWENESLDLPITTHYYVGTGAASLRIEGGKAIDDDTNAGDVTDFWFSNGGISTYIHGLLVYSPGRKATQLVQSISPCVWWISVFNDSESTLPTITTGPSPFGTLFANGLFSPSTSVQSQFLIPSIGPAFSASYVSLKPGWGSGSSVSYVFGTTQRFSFVVHSVGNQQAQNPGMEITFPTPWPTVPFYVCKMVGGTGAVTPIYGEATASTQGMVLTFVGTPVSGLSYQIQCVGE